LGTIWALVVPPFGAPDEPAHLQAVAQVRDRGELPYLRLSFDRDPRGEITWPPPDAAIVAAARRAGQDDSLRLAPYESFQPPLFYVLGALVTWPFRSSPVASLFALRMLSVVFGAGTVVACYWVVRWLAPDEPLWAVASAGTLALMPQACFNAATAGNDSLVNFLCAAGLASLFRSLRDPSDDPWMARAGAIAGAAFLAKQNGLALVPTLALTVLYRTLDAQRQERPRHFLNMTIGSAAAFLLIGGWWCARNVFVYGEPTAVADIARYFRARFIPISITSASAWNAVIETAWQSFWGRFGWMDRYLPEAAYAWTTALAALLVCCTIVRLTMRRGRVSRPAWRSGALMLVFTSLTAGLFIWVNFVSHGFQAQGRYFLPAAVPIVALLTGGLAWSGRWSRSRRVALGAFWGWLMVLQGLGWLAVRG
jgi:4-amino-4-deoxy-L-arabinose transferase-like glycosyltransferase